MLKVMAFLRRKADLTREQFIAYYESRHAPFVLGLMPGILAYRRNYIESDGTTGEAAPDMGFDVVTEIWFADRQAFDRAMRVMADPAAFARLAADEENVFDRSQTRFIIVDEHSSAIGSERV